MSLTSAFILMLQVGPNPAAGETPDYSAEIQDRPPRTRDAGVIGPLEKVPPSIANSWLKNCLSLVESEPARAHVQAQLRATSQTGEARVLANHCLGLAATQLARWDEAQTAFIAARDEAPMNDARFRARLGTMAAGAAMSRADTEAALTFLGVAQRDAEAARATDLQAIIAIEQARVLVGQGRLAEAEPHLVHAQKLRLGDVEAPLLLATLLRRMDRLDEAQAQIEAASALAPRNPAIGLEAGVIAVLDGRDDAARISWQSVVDTAPDSDFAKTALGYIAQLEPGGATTP
jgi:tetratricopeptide (TPR) repeat protein